MIFERIRLCEKFDALGEAKSDAVLEVYAREKDIEFGDKQYPAVVLCPGGGYFFTSSREAEPVALALLAKGIACFVLRYSAAPARYPTQLLETAAAFAYVRQNAQYYSVMEESISVMGFSAGGHLAGSYGTHWGEETYAAALHTDKEALRPNGMILCYGVLSMLEKTHEGTAQNLLGGLDDWEMRKKLSLEHAVNGETPPAFIWHTCQDDVVPVENSLYAAEALSKAGIPYELHIYPDGGHGISLANWLVCDPQELPPRYLTKWIDDCTDWILRLSRNADR